MENKTRNSIEKICLVGTIIGTSLLGYGAKSDNENIICYGLILANLGGTGYILSSSKRKDLEKQKNYYYKK